MAIKGSVDSSPPVADRLLAEEEFDVVWTCGPEVMMQKVCESAGRRGIPVYCSVERQMKCALGLCDACALGPLHVCVMARFFRRSGWSGCPISGGSSATLPGRRVHH